MLLRVGILSLVSMVSSSCAASRTGMHSQEALSWDGSVRVHGTLRAIFHEGQSSATVNLDSLLPNPRLYAVGALAELAGEVTVVGGVAYLSYPSGPDETRTEATSRTTRGAALLVVAEVGAWQSVTTTRTIPFEELDQEIAGLAVSAGMRLDERFPFLIEGEVQDLQWHVIDGGRLPGGVASHQDHAAASVQESAEHAKATLVGFFSETDQGVFTHAGARTHIHSVVHEPLSSGHVDHVVIPAGTTVKFPAAAK